MAHARIVQAIGSVDGVNRTFMTPVPYVPGSTAYILNGTIHSPLVPRGPDNPFGYVESNPDGGQITVDVAPQTNDVVQIFFWDRFVVPSPSVDKIVAVLKTTPRLTGVMREARPERLTGTLRVAKISGVVSTPEPDHVTGIAGVQKIIGVVKEGC